MLKNIGSWVVSILGFLLVAWFLTWLYKALDGSIFLIIVLILLLERAINRINNTIKSLQARNVELEDKCENLSWQLHDLKNKMNDET